MHSGGLSDLLNLRGRRRGFTAAGVVAAVATGAALGLTSPALAAAHPAAAGWSPAAVRSPVTTYFEPSAGLFGVSCYGTATCVAGGEYVSSAGHVAAMVVTGSRGTWARARPLALPHTSYDKFGSGLVTALTCTSPGDCTAVGYLGAQYGFGNGRGFISAEVKGRWRAAKIAAEPSNASPKAYSELFSVACASGGNCTTVGFYTNRAFGYDATALTETRGRWQRPAEVMLPANASGGSHSDASLASVQCQRAGSCLAVGRYLTKAGVFQAMRVSQSRGRWGRAAEIRLPANAAANPHAGLASMSCTSRAACIAVGDYTTKAGASTSMAVSESAGRWSAATAIASLPSNAAANAGAGLYTVSCQPSFCQAVGGYVSAAGSRLWMAISRTSGHWGKAIQIPEPGNAAGGTTQQGYPYALSCTSSRWCTAVGTYIPVGGLAQPMAATRS